MKIWLWPIVIAMLSCAALLLGLVFENLWDDVAALTLGLPVILSLWFNWRSRNTLKQVNQKSRA